MENVRNSVNHTETNFDIDILRTLIIGVRHQSLARAAKLRGKSPSTVSLQIQRLEQQLGIKLFRRKGRGVLATEEAQNLLPYAEAIVLKNDEAVRLLHPGRVAESIRLAVPADLGEAWLPPILAAFLRDYPDTTIDTQVMRNTEIINGFSERSIEVALHWTDPADVADDDLIAILPIEWMAAKSFSVDPDHTLPLVVLETPCLFRELGLNKLESAARPSRIAMESSGVTGLWAAVAAGLGVTCRVPIGIPDHVAIYTDNTLPKLGTIGLALRATASSRTHQLKDTLDLAFQNLIATAKINSHRVDVQQTRRSKVSETLKGNSKSHNKVDSE